MLNTWVKQADMQDAATQTVVENIPYSNFSFDWFTH